MLKLENSRITDYPEYQICKRFTIKLMKFHRGWLVVAPICLTSVLVALLPLLRISLQSLIEGTSKLDWHSQPIARPVITPDKREQLSPVALIQASVAPAVVTIYGANGVGSGMILRSQGLVLTNKHIVSNYATVNVKTASGESLSGTVVDFDLQHDLALIRLNPPFPHLPTVTLADSATLKAGDRVYAIGSPGGKSGTLTMGTFTRITPHGSLQTSTQLLNPGNSGGPLLNAAGLVIGVNKGLLSDNSGLATPISAVKTLLKRYDTVNQKAQS